MSNKKIPDTEKDLTIIASHINADFDALSSMLAAQKLYPDAIVVFPGSQEKNLRNFFISSMAYLFNMADIKDIDFSKIKRLIIVDTKQAGRIGKLSALLKNPEIEIHIFDHHPPMTGDIKGAYEVHRSTGANVTILIEIIKERGIDISPDEATIMCLGIYEDTGSFTFPSTTERDFMAAAFLISAGANLNTISNLIAREISPAQVTLLNEMIQAAIYYNISGIEIAVTKVTTDNYVPDFAFLVHKLLKMEDFNAIFAIGLMGSKIYIVARSKVPEVDVGAIVTPLGGGGHHYAAAATIKDKTLAQTEHQLLAILDSQIKSRRQAKDLMTSPPITTDANVSCKEASDLLTRYNINTLLVTEKPQDPNAPSAREKLSGFISRQIIDKALYHKLDHVPIREYMTTEWASVAPDADLLELQEKIIENKQRILPVIDKEAICGVITRTDLLNMLIQRSNHSSGASPNPYEEPVHARTRNINRFLNERLSSRLVQILKTIGKVASEIGYDAYVAGGFVRDLFLYRSNEDLDIVIEGDGILFAKKYAGLSGARIHAYEKFGTAVIIFPDGFKIDVASARLEYYKFPAALPVVEMSSIKLDLFRRDFTINTLAVQLNPDKFGTLIDFFAAQKDIKKRVIRVLHNLSFVEDPSRVFRAIRFEQRFGFSVGKVTAGLIANAVKMNFFRRLSGRRVFAELRQVLEEENPTPAILRMQDYNLFTVIHPSMVLNNELNSLLSSVKTVLSWYDLLFFTETYMKWAVYFLALMSQFDMKTSEEICKRLELAPRYTTIFLKERLKAEKSLLWLEQNQQLSNSALYKKLYGIKTEIILYMMAVTKHKKVKQSISHFFTKLKYIEPSIRGKDLLKTGIEPGPIYSEVLRAVLDAKLNGKLKTQQDELNFVRQYDS